MTRKQSLDSWHRQIELAIHNGLDRRRAKRLTQVEAARDAVLDALAEATESMSWAQERDLLVALTDDLELRRSDNSYRKPAPRKARS